MVGHARVLNTSDRYRDAGFLLVNKLAKVLPDERQSSTSLKVLELGCGTGLVGLAMGILLQNCHVTLTDLETASSLVHENISQNQKSFAPGSSAEFKVLEWANHPEWLSKMEYNVIFVGDCIYNTDYAHDLLKTLQFVLQDCSIIILASKLRHKSEDSFDEMLVGYGITAISRLTISLENEPDCPDEVAYFKVLVKSGLAEASRLPEWIKNHPLEKLLKVDN
jgi:precorrin-6B methylase 2